MRPPLDPPLHYDNQAGNSLRMFGIDESIFVKCHFFMQIYSIFLSGCHGNYYSVRISSTE